MNRSDTHTDSNNGGGDAPQGWDRYGSLLRSLPVRQMNPERSAAMLPAIHASIPAYVRRRRAVRFIAAPALSMATVVVAFLLGMLPAIDDDRGSQFSPTIPQPVAREQARPAHHAPRRRIELPYLPQAGVATGNPDTLSVPMANHRMISEPSVAAPVTSGPGPGPGIARAHTTPGH